jgi:excisionase family DNA binding protein
MSASALVLTTAEELTRLIEQATTRGVEAGLKRFDTTTAPDEEYLSKSKSARLLGVSTSTIDNYVRQGKLRKYPFTGKTVRFKRAELLALITK